MEQQQLPRWVWRRLLLDKNGDPDEQIAAAVLGQGILMFLIGWVLWHGGAITLTDFATAQGFIWGACGVGKFTTGLNNGYQQDNR